MEAKGGRDAKATAMRMKTYRLVVRESAGGQPSELVTEMASDLRAADFARQRVAADPRILEIEIWSGEARLCRMQRRKDEVGASAVELGIVAEDALLVECNASRRS